MKTILSPLKIAFMLCSCLFVSFFTQADSISEFESKLLQYQGKVVYVDFWASWCGPCRQSFPWMNEMQSTYQDKGFEIISINLDSEYSLAQKFLSKYPATFDVIYDPDGLLAKKYQVQGMPSSFTLNSKSQVKGVHVGFTEEKSHKYQKEIITLLNTKS
ncbi:TlpA disulfide reductase family protein [Thalassotalea piscium]